MDKRDNTIKALGFDALICGLYFVIILVSFVLTISLFANNNIKASCSTCFIFVVPCILDGIKDFITCNDRKKPLVIIDAILTVFLCAIAVIMLVFIFSNDDFALKSLTFAEYTMYASVVGCIRYAFITGFLIYEIVQEKKKLKEGL